ncbi:MAG TPA: MgtC/SapB family protein [Fibrobacteria bacterium]|nr:MgtC/SapB family protein [Fibrobacteria bacterium]
MNSAHLHLGFFLLRVAEALFLGCVIGAERQRHHRMAGLRTNALVATGACLFVSVVGLVPGLESGSDRIAAQVVSGIGFLGAGVIMRDGLNVRGLNTAATLWCSAAIGVLSGMGLYAAAAIGAAAILGANLVLPILSERVDRMEDNRAPGGLFQLRLVCEGAMAGDIRTRLLARLEVLELSVQELRLDNSRDTDRVDILANVLADSGNRSALDEAMTWAAEETGVFTVGWKAADDRI